MAFESPKRQPHEILGVRADADLIEITVAFNRLASRCNPQFHPGDEVAAMRFKRLREAFETMSAAQGFKPTPDPFFNEDHFDFGPPPRQTAFNYRPEGKHREYARAAELIEQYRQRTRAEDAREMLNRRIRINRLQQDWTAYNRMIHRRHETVDALKAERGLSFTFLKNVIRRTDDDRALWAAESYLRRGHESGEGLHYDLRSLGIVINELRHHLRANELDLINPWAIDMAEDDLRHRRIMFEQAVGILKGKGPEPR